MQYCIEIRQMVKHIGQIKDASSTVNSGSNSVPQQFHFEFAALYLQYEAHKKAANSK